ncbi:MFS transporter, partial [Actinomadura napierensis]|uniref:MFS transporter n=1 Tax=Actinomadura napierensis TaxID=267854 RepID=UPI0031D9117E
PYPPLLLLPPLPLPPPFRARETRRADAAAGGGLRDALRVPEARRRRFLTVVVPLAPWVFASAAVALAYLPGQVEDRLGGYALVYSAAVAALASAAGIAVQPLARRARTPQRLRTAAMGLVIAGMLVAAGAAAATSPWLAVAAALVLGAGYGSCQVCGLQEVQRLARPDRLAALTSVYQAVSYLGFAVPFPLAAAGRLAPPAVLLLITAGLAVLTLVIPILAGTAGGPATASRRPPTAQPEPAAARNVRR